MKGLIMKSVTCLQVHRHTNEVIYREAGTGTQTYGRSDS